MANGLIAVTSFAYRNGRQFFFFFFVREVLHSTGGKLAINIDKTMSDSGRCYGENKTGLPRVGW